MLSSGIDDLGYTSTDSISGDPLHHDEWQLLQVKPRALATNPGVAQCWHWGMDDKVMEHQVLQLVRRATIPMMSGRVDAGKEGKIRRRVDER